MTTNPITKLIPLTQGKFTIVNADDYDLLMRWKWHARNDGYAGTNVPKALVDGKTRKTMLLHRFIMNAPFGVEIDHVDGDKLNNCRKNLRFCSRSQNNSNKLSANGTSKFKGVSWEKSAGRWRADITLNYSQIFLGRFSCELDAAIAYNAAALEYHGAFAKLNAF